MRFNFDAALKAVRDSQAERRDANLKHLGRVSDLENDAHTWVLTHGEKCTVSSEDYHVDFVADQNKTMRVYVRPNGAYGVEYSGEAGHMTKPDHERITDDLPEAQMLQMVVEWYLTLPMKR